MWVYCSRHNIFSHCARDLGSTFGKMYVTDMTLTVFCNYDFHLIIINADSTDQAHVMISHKAETSSSVVIFVCACDTWYESVDLACAVRVH